MKMTTAKDLLNVTHTIGPITGVPREPPRRDGGPEGGNSIEGVLIFCGIGLGLTVLAVIFQWLEVAPPYF